MEQFDAITVKPATQECGAKGPDRNVSSAKNLIYLETPPPQQDMFLILITVTFSIFQ